LVGCFINVNFRVIIRDEFEVRISGSLRIRKDSSLENESDLEVLFDHNREPSDESN
jgi:hypothetical protein